MMKLNPKNQLTQNSKSILATSLALLVCTPVQAQPFNPLLLEQRPGEKFSQLAAPLLPDDGGALRAQAGSFIFARPRPPRGTGAPRRRRGGGTRGDCGEGDTQPTIRFQEQPLIALVPESVGGLTTAERPTFWFYLSAQPSLTGEFVLQEQNGTVVYNNTTVTLPAKPEVIHISLPSNVPPLEIGKTYEWYLNIRCKANSPTSKPSSPLLFVAGWIQRTALNPSLESQLQNATPQQKVALYASNGIWYEALTIAAELYKNNPKDTNWTELLQDVGLGEIASGASVQR